MTGQELQLTGGKMNGSAISILSGTQLWTLLTNSQTSKDVAAEIAACPNLREMVELYYQDMKRLAQPIGRTKAGAEIVYNAMKPLLIMYGTPNKAPAERTAWWFLYQDKLADLPLIALEHAVSEYIRTSEVHAVPPPGKLVKLAEPKALELRMVVHRMRMALEVKPPKPPPSAEDREWVRQQMAGLKHSFRPSLNTGPRPQPVRVYDSDVVKRGVVAGLNGQGGRAMPVT